MRLWVYWCASRNCSPCMYIIENPRIIRQDCLTTSYISDTEKIEGCWANFVHPCRATAHMYTFNHIILVRMSRKRTLDGLHISLSHTNVISQLILVRRVEYYDMPYVASSRMTSPLLL